jgi:uncharacterized protein (DUF4415 family)
MENEENIKQYTAEQVKAMRERGEDRSDWAKVNSMTEEELEAAIASDPDEAGIEWDWEKAKLVMPEPKEHINLRVDADVLRFFKSQGKGYQTRMNAVLRAYVEAQQAKTPKRAKKAV